MHARTKLCIPIVAAFLARAAAGFCADPAAPLQEGHRLYLEGRVEEAAQLYRDAAASGERAPDRALFALGAALETLGRSGEARTAYGRAIQADGGSFEARTNIGILAYREGNLEEASLHFAAARTIRPRSSRAHHHVALIHLSAGHLEKARSNLRRAMELDAGNAAAMNDRAVLQWREENIEGALETLERASAVGPNEEIVRENLALAYMRLGRPAEAAEILSGMMHDPPTRRRLAPLLGLAYLMHGDYSLALPFLASPGPAPFRMEPRVHPEPVGIRHIAIAEATRRVEMLGRHPEHQAELASTLVHLGRLHESNNDLPKALAAWRKAEKLGASDAEAAYALGRFYLESADPQRAIGSLERAARAEPDRIDIRLVLGDAYRLSGATGIAQTIYGDILRDDPSSAEAHRGLGLALLDEQDYGGALEALDRAVSLGKDSAEIRIAMGDAHAALGRPDLAETEYDRALDRDPSASEAHHRLGRLYLSENLPDKAARAYREARERDPSDREASSQLEAIKGRKEPLVTNLGEAIVMFPVSPLIFLHSLLRGTLPGSEAK